MKNDPHVRPVSVTPRTASRMLDLSYDAFRRRLMNAGVFTVLRPRGAGVGRRCYIPTDEVEVYGRTRDEAAVRRLRELATQPPAGA